VKLAPHQLGDTRLLADRTSGQRLDDAQPVRIGLVLAELERRLEPVDLELSVAKPCMRSSSKAVASSSTSNDLRVCIPTVTGNRCGL